MKKLRFKKYNYGGLGQIGSQIVDTIDPEDEYGVQSTAGALGSGALKGAGVGASIGSAIPGVGTAIGAGVGALVGGGAGLIQNNRNRQLSLLGQQREGILNKQIQNNNYINLLNSGYKSQGNQGQEFYKHGGKLSRLSNNSVEVQGASHENGGVKINSNLGIIDEDEIDAPELKGYFIKKKRK